MMIKISYGSQSEHLKDLREFIENKKQQENFKILDVGSAVSSMFFDVVDSIVDFVPVNGFNGKTFQGDINKPYVWDEVKNWTEKNGKYDFSICRHVLEDINNPEYVCDMLSKVSNSGYIAMPSGKYWEMAKGNYENLPESRGLHHHRWIYLTKNMKLYGLPKMGWTDSIKDDQLNYPLNKNLELEIYWEKSIDGIWLLPILDNLPSNYPGDSFVDSCLKGCSNPWDLWLKMLNIAD